MAAMLASSPLTGKPEGSTGGKGHAGSGGKMELHDEEISHGVLGMQQA
ncbi:hypothetical protein J5W63_11125 [Akkermansia massiliensis]|jgi:hypothetical protein|nr:hypothetical protein [Akkermansia massiliensis]QWP02608.1 hypothetical protein J5W47_10895 [Akkermansia massiliensis]QWP21285.1 hypothetical protein J5W63_11125 [Akkermansia massiliensis]QWP53303.1 hypothetical protein J5W53_11140 [Akkermansia massiliensis]QWP67823.1 hypothetical protein J5W74_11135 [Akkermansia massiliensis]